MKFLNEIMDPNIDSDIDSLGHLISISQRFNDDFPDTHLSIYDMRGEEYVLVNVAETVNAAMHLPVETMDALIPSREFILYKDSSSFPAELKNLSNKYSSVYLQRLELPDGSRVLAVLSLNIRDDEKNPYSVLDSELTDILIARMLQRYINRIIHMQDRAELSNALKEVKIIKEKLMPAADYQIEGLKYAKHYAPCLAGGGDHFDLSDLIFARLRRDKEFKGHFWGGSIVDVSGHGPAAAVEVAMMDAILRTYHPSSEYEGPGGVLSYINRHIFTRQLRGAYITTIIFTYDSGSRIFNYSSAGHLPAIIKYANKSKGTGVLDQATDIPLGIMREHKWDNAEARVAAKDCIILYTDGITESKNNSGKEFGVDGIIDAIHDIQDPNPQLIVNTIMDALYTHRGTKDHVDDETILVLQPQ